MAHLPGRLLAELRPTGMVRMIFISQAGSANDPPLIIKDLDAAEVVFMTCGLTKERAVALRAELERDKAVTAEAMIDDTVAAQFRRAGRAHL
jgi:hypothetical protein